MQGNKTAKKGRQRDEFEEQVLDLRRVTRVTAGGKRFRFRATVVVGNGKGKVGVGTGKGPDVQSAIQKARERAKKELITLTLKDRTIPHEVEAKYSAARVLIKPAKVGHGLMAGGAPRVVLRLAGVRDATAKCIGKTSNKLTNALAALEALKSIKSSSSRTVADNAEDDKEVSSEESSV